MNKKTWRICIPDPFPNCEKIYPIQQKKVAAMLDVLKQDANVKKIIIFGSSVTTACHVGSDVDVYVELQENKKLKVPFLNFVFDLWTNFTVDERLLRNIVKNGVVVYENSEGEK